MTVEDLLAFHVPNEIKFSICQKRVSPFDQLAPFSRLFAVRDQTNPGILDAANLLCVDTSHDGKLQQIFGFTVGIGADIHYTADTCRSGEWTCQRGAVYTADAAKPEQGSDHRRASIS